MQRLNKELVKRKLVYTWYFYPIILGVSLLCWIWGFQTFHQPTAYEKVVMFVGAEVKDLSFTKGIIEEHKDKGMKDFQVPSCNDTLSVYAQKLNLYLSSADLFILPQSTLDNLTSNKEASASFMKDYFRPINDTVKTEYLNSSCEYYTFTDEETSTTTDYGVLINKKNETSFLSDYVNFKSEENYYMLIGITSVNVGAVYGEGNAEYTNALTSMSYIVSGGVK